MQIDAHLRFYAQLCGLEGMLLRHCNCSSVQAVKNDLGIQGIPRYGFVKYSPYLLLLSLTYLLPSCTIFIISTELLKSAGVSVEP
jgi:hypothetical protein